MLMPLTYVKILVWAVFSFRFARMGSVCIFLMRINDAFLVPIFRIILLEKS